MWACDFVEGRARGGRKYRMSCVVGEFTREALAVRVARKPTLADVVDTPAGLFVARGVPVHARPDQGPEFVAAAVKGWVAGAGAAVAYTEKGSPQENGHVESFNARPRDELLDG